jgi:hypothetical protein
MGDMWDAVTWQNLTGKAGAKAGYRDGAQSQWPAEAWEAFKADALLNITVLADEQWECFDSEVGDAPVGSVATAVANRLQDKKWSVVYTNQSNINGQTTALGSKGVHWTDAQFWPEPGCYLWAADPSGSIKAGRWTPPVTPVAVQDQWEGSYDHSTTHGTFPALAVPLPPPVPEPQSKMTEPAVGICATPSGKGYWLVSSDGGVFSFGDAGFHGSLGGVKLDAPIVGMACTPSGKGYWLLGSDGGVFGFGDAKYDGGEAA